MQKPTEKPLFEVLRLSLGVLDGALGVRALSFDMSFLSSGQGLPSFRGVVWSFVRAEWILGFRV